MERIKGPNAQVTVTFFLFNVCTWLAQTGKLARDIFSRDLYESCLQRISSFGEETRKITKGKNTTNSH